MAAGLAPLRGLGLVGVGCRDVVKGLDPTRVYGLRDSGLADLGFRVSGFGA